MTTTEERFNSIRNMRRTLWMALKDESIEELVLTKKDICRFCKHFPEEYWIDKVEKMYEKEEPAIFDTVNSGWAKQMSKGGRK